MSKYEVRGVPNLLLTIKDPVVTDIKITRDTVYDENTYIVTMVVATPNSILEILLEPIKGSTQALRLYNLLGCNVASFNMNNDCGKPDNYMLFDLEVRGGRGNQILMLAPIKVPFKSFILSGRADVEQISFINTIDTNNLSFKIKDRVTDETKWYNFYIEGTPEQRFDLVDKIYARQAKTHIAILSEDNILYFGGLALHLSCDIKGE